MLRIESRLPWLVLLTALGPAAAVEVDPVLVYDEAARRGERLWQSIATDEPQPTLGIRNLFAYARALCEARTNPERLDRLFHLAQQAQDDDPQSHTYGNFHWYWHQDEVTDRNAVEFCMQDAAVIWLRHRQWLPAAARQRLEEIVAIAVDGCLRHRVPTSYTNIAVLNAGNLIVLGEALDRPEATEEGYRRLEAICVWTWEFGTHEYDSPTYYGVDLDGLLFIEALAGREQGRRQARALLEVFWMDIAANWFPAAMKLAGPHSRSYDYLRGLGNVDRHLWLHDWLEGPQPGAAGLVQPLLGGWQPPATIRDLSERFPRLVRQSWGVKRTESRTHWIDRDVTLGVSGSLYGPTDMPLTVDLAGDRHLVRGYFIADGREDPYGKNRYAVGRSGHRKALHLRPFWAGAQRQRDVLGLVVYRDADLTDEVLTNLQSHFVLRRDMDGFWLGGEPLEPGEKTPIACGESLVARAGTAAIGIRVLWARTREGNVAPVHLVDDGNPHGAVRLTVEHASNEHSTEAGALFWVRVGTGLDRDEAFHDWRAEFESASPTHVTVTSDTIHAEVPAGGGPVGITAARPFGRGGGVELIPEPSGAVLELNGNDIGRAVLNDLPVIRAHREAAASFALQVPAEGDVAWEAEDGWIFPGMEAAEDGDCSNGQYVAQPKEATWRSGTGSITWKLQVEKAGRYWLWARILAPDGETDSFYLSAQSDTDELLGRSSWHTGRSPTWTWRAVRLDLAEEPTPLDLPAGECRLRLQVREAGTRIDRLWLTSRAGATPPAE